jgi:hypothetical protein
MGSTRRSKSTSRNNRLRGAETISTRRGRRSKSIEIKTVLYEVLHHFSKALSLVETIARAFEAAQHDGQCSGTGAEVAALRQGVTALRVIHEEFDLASAKVSP